ncbi:MAG TPA: porin [bacterium]|nr:porin [bacterium]
MSTTSALAAIVCGALAASSAIAAEVNGEWKDGLRFTSEDKSVEISIGGFFQNDWTWQTADEDLRFAAGEEFPDGTEFRRARLAVSGTFEETTEFKAEYEFAKGEAGLRDVYIGLKKLPVIGGVRVGHFKEPFSLQQLTSDRYLIFIERSLADVFSPVRNTGIMIGNGYNRATWYAGYFREADGFGNGSGGGDSHGTARVTFLPYDGGEDNSRLIHLGIAGSLRNPPGDNLVFAARPETNLAPRVVNTGDIDATEEVLLGAEAAAVFGRFSAQGEFMQAMLEADLGGDPTFMGGYGEASWMLTGEHRNYSRRSGVFDRLRPLNPFKGPGSGPGAWELAARWSYLDLSDENVAGGEVTDLSAAVNWYINSNFRVMTNYVHSEVEDSGSFDGFTTRFQCDF